MEGRRLGRGEALRKLLEKQNTPSGRTAPIQDESEASADPVQPPRPAGRSAIFAAQRKPDPTPPQLPIAGRGRALLAAAKAATSSPDVDAVTAGITRLTPQENIPEPEELPKHPVIQKGSSGREAHFTANYVRLKVEQDKGVFQYAVTFEPPVDSKSARFGLMKQCTEVIGETRLFDGAILYLPFKMNQKTTILHGNLKFDNSVIKIIINYVCKHNFGDHSVIHLYNVLFRRIMILLGMAEHGSNFFDPRTAMPLPLHKLEVWPGYVTAIDEYEGGLMLCCDASHRVLRNQTVLELMQDLENSRRNSWRDDFVHLILGQSVLTRYNNKVYRVDDVSFNESPMDSFEKSNGEKMTYKTYYAQQYNLIIKEDRQPLLKSKLKKRLKGQIDQLVSLVPELCYLTGITDEMRADLKVMKDITQCIQINPQQRMYAINKYIRTVKGSPEATKILGDWGLSLDTAYTELPGRILPPVDITFGDRGYFRGNTEANWSGAANKNKALTAVEILKWSVICTKRDEQSVAQFIDQMQKFSSNIGVRMLRPKYSTMNDDRTDSYIRALRSISKGDDQIVMAVLPLARNDKYSAIKKICCVEEPIPSQVMLSKTIRKGITARAIALKVAHQMNCKLGGTSWSVHIPLQNTMVCGLDSYHDPKRQMNSVGALVSSLNQNLTRWYSRVFFQPPGYEFVDGLIQTMLSSLENWHKVNGMYPEQVILYRDGVSDGQIKLCREHEIPQILKAFKQINPGYNPKFLYVITQKRINTRYFLTEGNQYTNPPPGSILDHTVTRRYLYDFFLVSQHVTQGTVSPTHYIVVHNTTQMSPDQVQRLSYTLTHLYYNWPGTIRVPAPCQYAHKLAYLVGENIHKEASHILSDKLYYL